MTVNTNAVAAAVNTTPEQKTLVGMINGSISELAKALPKHLSPERLARIATTAIRQNPKLMQCTPASFMGSLFTAAQLGLEPVAGLAYLIPFDNSKLVNGQWIKVTECQFVIGYKGVGELFYRHEKSGLIDWGIVHEKDEFSYEYGTNAHIKHKPAQGERGAVIGYYGIFKLNTGFSKFLYMTHTECMEHGKKHSKTYNQREQAFNKKSPWATNPDSMCLKTVLIQVAKTMPMATELRRALETDETSREYKDGITDALDLPVSGWQEAEVETKEIPQADTSKVAAAIGTELTASELLAKAQAAKEKLHSDEPKDDYSDSGFAPEPTKIILKGLIASHEQKGKGPHKFYVEGKWSQTFDKTDAETLLKHKEAEDEIELSCHEEKSVYKEKEYVNIVIDAISAITK